MKNKTDIIIQPAELVNMSVPEAVLEEVKYNFVHSYPIQEFGLIRDVFKDFMDLFNGRYKGYRSCNMPYHDILHSTDTLLVFSRIVDGYNIEKKVLPVKKVKTGIIAALFHDSGYIQRQNDTSGTGAKYTQVHEKRSIAFIRNYFRKLKLNREDFLTAKNIILCTDLKVSVSDIKFKTEEEKILGYMVGTSDLVAQMSERMYLEKLMLLYEEFKEAKISEFNSEYDFLKKTISFYEEVVKKRLEKDFKDVYKFLRTHFKERYHIDSSLYINAIETQLNYLKKILESSPESYRKRLKRKR